jgi:large subunit ribosomal protein L21
MYAIVEISGLQYKIYKKDKLYIPILKKNIGETVIFNRVLLFNNDGLIKLGYPILNNVQINCKILSIIKLNKILIFKKKRRKGYKKTYGHRQKMSHIEVLSIIQK